MRASSSKNIHQCHLGIYSCCPTFLRPLSLITPARQIQTFILLLGTVRPFGGIQTPQWLSIATSKERSQHLEDLWESAHNIKGTVLGVTVLLFPSLGAIISLESGVEPDKKVYRITINHFPKCTCPDFLNMAVASIGIRG
jgi:hypothetical protein